MRPEELVQTLMKMQKETESGKLNWRLEVQTTERNKEKYTVSEDGQTWEIDECYVSYCCNYRGKEFCMITYEMIKKSGDFIHTNNYIFLPPSGVRLFSLHTLLEHSVELNAMLVSQVHVLWEYLTGLAKKESSQVKIQIGEATVHIE